MTVTVYLRLAQSIPLTWGQVDSNFTNLANAINNNPAPTGGPTASRPASPILYQSYFDTDLGYQIQCSAILPSVIWVNAAGVQV